MIAGQAGEGSCSSMHIFRHLKTHIQDLDLSNRIEHSASARDAARPGRHKAAMKSMLCRALWALQTDAWLCISLVVLFLKPKP